MLLALCCPVVTDRRTESFEVKIKHQVRNARRKTVRCIDLLELRYSFSCASIKFKLNSFAAPLTRTVCGRKSMKIYTRGDF